MNQIINQIVDIEWEMMQNVNAVGGRAECQDNEEIFKLMRNSQFIPWYNEVLESYLNDLIQAKAVGYNKVMEKYARMMVSTDKKGYEEIKDKLPKISTEHMQLTEQIVEIEVSLREKFNQNYPCFSKEARPIYTREDSDEDISFETYLRGELLTYSFNTLVLYGRMIVDKMNKELNIVEEAMEATAKFYGYTSLMEADEKLHNN